MPISLKQEQVIGDLADILYPLLPASTPSRDWSLTFPAAAKAAGFGHVWPIGTKTSKRPGIVRLLTASLGESGGRFTDLITEIIRRAIRKKNDGPVTRETVESIILAVRRLGLGLPAVEDKDFLASLPSQKPSKKPTEKPLERPAGTRMVQADETQIEYAKLVESLVALESLEPVRRGFAFERFLNDLWTAFGLAPRGSFRLTGEQIDGSFQLDGSTYLVEARWRQEWADREALDVLQSKVERRAYARGLFVSYAGFSPEGLLAFRSGKPTRIICLDAFDLFYVLKREISLIEALRKKQRKADEENAAYIPLQDLFDD